MKPLNHKTVNLFRIGWTVIEKSRPEYDPKWTRLCDLLPTRRIAHHWGRGRGYLAGTDLIKLSDEALYKKKLEDDRDGFGGPSESSFVLLGASLARRLIFALLCQQFYSFILPSFADGNHRINQRIRSLCQITTGNSLLAHCLSNRDQSHHQLTSVTCRLFAAIFYLIGATFCFATLTD